MKNFLFYRVNEFEKTEFILGLLLNSPENLEQTSPPTSLEVDNFVCTLNRNKVSVADAKADGKGAYGRKGISTKCYFYNGALCQEAHKDENNNFFINKRTNENATWRKDFVDKESIFFLKRHYRYNKSNEFNQLIVEVQRYTKLPLDHFYVLYRRNKNSTSIDQERFDDSSSEIEISRHGNATNPHTGTFLTKKVTCIQTSIV